MSTSTSSPTSPRTLAAGNVALIVSGGLALLTVLRVWVAVGLSASSTVTALGVLDRTGLLLSTLVAAVDLCMIGLLVAIVVSWVFRTPWQWWPHARLYVAIAIVSVLLWTAPLLGLGMIVVLLVLVLWIVMMVRQLHGVVASDRRLQRAVLVIITAAAPIFALQVPDIYPWQLDEQVVIDETTTYDHQLVLGTSGNQTLLIAHNGHGDLRWVPTDDVTSRRVCGDTSGIGWPARSLRDVIVRSPSRQMDYADCDSPAPNPPLIRSSP